MKKNIIVMKWGRSTLLALALRELKASLKMWEENKFEVQVDQSKCLQARLDTHVKEKKDNENWINVTREIYHSLVGKICGHEIGIRWNRKEKKKNSRKRY